MSGAAMAWGRRLGALLAAMSVSGALAACGTMDFTEVARMVEAPVGSWELESAEFDDGSVGAGDLEELAARGMRVTLDLDDDGTLLIDAFGQQQTGLWELRDPETVSLTLEDETVRAPIADERLTLVYDGETMVFAKVSDEPNMDRDPSENAGDLGEGLVDVEKDLGEGLGEKGDGSDGPGGPGDSADDEFSQLFSDEMMVWQQLYVSSVELEVPLDLTVGDDEVALVRVTGIGVDVEGDTGYLVSVENRTDTDLILTNTQTLLDGEDVWADATLSCVVRAGDTADGFLYVDRGVATVTEDSSCEVSLVAMDREENVLVTYDATI